MKLKVFAIVVLAAVGVGAAFIALGGLPTSAASTTRYLTGTATTGDVSDDVAATGTIATTHSYGLAFGSEPHVADATASSSSSSSSGTGSTTWDVTELKVKVGDTVKAGEVLAKASTTDLQRQLDDATAALANAKIQESMAQTTFDAATTTAQIQQATIQLNNAKTQVSDARKARTDLINQIHLATITSPIPGVVTAVNVTRGLAAPSGDAIVIDATSFQVTADVVETDLPKIVLGQAASVAVNAVGATLDGTVSAIAPTTTTANTSGNVVSYAVTVTLKNAPAATRAGMTADVTITVASATNVLTVPAAALRGTAGAYTVLILGADGTPTAQPVDVGLVTNTTAEIKTGLSDGQQVVTGVATAQTGTPTTNGGFGGGGIGIPGGGFGGGGGRNRVGN